MSVDEERELALRRLQVLFRSGLFSIRDFKTNPLRIFAAHELCTLADVSCATKMTVQLNLFGGTVLKVCGLCFGLGGARGQWVPLLARFCFVSSTSLMPPNLQLGTEKHHRQLLGGIDSLEDIGCFGLTELGFGG